MNDHIEIGDLKGSHKIWLVVAIGAVVVALLLIGLVFVSPNPSACIGSAAVCLALAGGMRLLLHFMDHTILLTPEGICWISKARQKVTPWSQVAEARVGKIFPTDKQPMLLVDGIDGNRICGYGSGLIRFDIQEVANMINMMKNKYGLQQPLSPP